ncbi:MAG TPA: hypothetical protein VHE78_12415 [Gemmatimonadaceae bacterium]|nr:hypothetical protein [Gemmatimonadaceae bacterium]
MEPSRCFGDLKRSANSWPRANRLTLCVVAGGAALAAQGGLVRVTGDVDVMAMRDEAGNITLAPQAFPPFLGVAIREVARELNLPHGWMNTQMADGLQAGLPPGFAERLAWRQYGGLHIGFVGRRDLIALKLEAASDDPPHGRSDVHLGDLVALGATPEEIDEAAVWVSAVNVDPRRRETIDWVKRHVAERRRR